MRSRSPSRPEQAPDETGGFLPLDSASALKIRFIYYFNIASIVGICAFLFTSATMGEAVLDQRTIQVFQPVLTLSVAAFFASILCIRSRRYFYGGLITLIMAYFTTVAAVMLTGGFPNSIALPCILLPVCYNYFVLGARAGLVTSLSIPLTLIAQVWLTSAFGFQLPDYTSAASPEMNIGILGVAVLLMLTIVLHTYEVNNAALHSALINDRDQLSILSNVDSLTGIANSRQFNKRMDQAVDALREGDGPFGVIFVDLDGFKQINDDYGHEAGDAVLKVVARRLIACVRDNDLVARAGGDEFTVLISQTADEEILSSVIQRARAALSEPIFHNGIELKSGASFGSTLQEIPSEDAADAIRRADKAMYRDKMQQKGLRLRQKDRSSGESRQPLAAA